MASRTFFVDEDDPGSPSGRVWRATEVVDGDVSIGGVIVTFDKKQFYNLFRDFPHNLTPEQIQILKEDMLYWYDFFKGRRST